MACPIAGARIYLSRDCLSGPWHAALQAGSRSFGSSMEIRDGGSVDQLLDAECAALGRVDVILDKGLVRAAAKHEGRKAR